MSSDQIRWGLGYIRRTYGTDDRKQGPRVVNTSISDAAAAVRKSPQGHIVALRLGYPTADELADWLETHADEALAQRLAPVVMRDVLRSEANATPSARAIAMGREIAAALRKYSRKPL